MISAELINFEKVEDILGNNAPRWPTTEIYFQGFRGSSISRAEPGLNSPTPRWGQVFHPVLLNLQRTSHHSLACTRRQNSPGSRWFSSLSSRRFWWGFTTANRYSQLYYFGERVSSGKLSISLIATISMERVGPGTLVHFKRGKTSWHSKEAATVLPQWGRG